MTESPAPRGLRPEEVALLVDELRPLVVGARIDKVVDAGGARGGAFALRLRGPAVRHSLLLTTRPGYTRFHLLPDHETAPARPSEEAQRLRELLRGGKILGIDQPGGDRVLRLELEVLRDGRVRRRQLVLELFGSGGRLLLLDAGTRDLLFVAGRGGVELGQRYRFPEAPIRDGDRVFLPFDPREQIPEEQRNHPLAFHFTLARRMAEAEAAGDLVEACGLLRRTVKKASEQRQRLLEKLDQEIAGAARWPEHQRSGELLKAAIGELRRGQASITVTDYFEPELPRVEISLDLRSTPIENIERYFRRARKGRRGHQLMVERRDRSRAELAQLQTALPRIDACETREELGAITQELAALKLRRRRSGRARNRWPGGSTARAQPRRFRSRQGFEILAGRNAAENDRLTFTIARGNDLFFHRAHHPGPHVILRVPGGHIAAPESLEDAAFLAAYLGGWRGPQPVIVVWTAVKNLRRPPGAPPGQVSLSQEREFRVRFRPELLAHLSVGDEAASGDRAQP